MRTQRVPAASTSMMLWPSVVTPEQVAQADVPVTTFAPSFLSAAKRLQLSRPRARAATAQRVRRERSMFSPSVGHSTRRSHTRCSRWITAKSDPNRLKSDPPTRYSKRCNLSIALDLFAEEIANGGFASEFQFELIRDHSRFFTLGARFDGQVPAKRSEEH